MDEVYAQVEKDGKKVNSVSIQEFLTTTGLGIPVLFAITPISILYQIGKLLSKPFFSPPEKQSLDTGTKVDPKDIIPREKRKYDVVLLGATGFTGSMAARYLAKTYGVGKEVKWAIAGRSKSKLEEVKEKLAAELGSDDILGVDTLMVDTSVTSTLPNLVKDTRAVISTAGPFSSYGSPVVEFCAKYGTHYADITGEIDWVKNMIVQWDDTAQRTGAKIVSFCGHDSIPWDHTVMALEKELPDGEELVRVECFDEYDGGASGGTMATILLFFKGLALGAPKYDFNVFLKLPDGSKSSSKTRVDLPFAVSKATPLHPRLEGKYSGFFLLAAANAELVKRSVALRQTSKCITYKETAVYPDWKSAFLTNFNLIAFGVLLSNPITCSLMEKYVLPKPGEGPSLVDQESKHFLLITGHGEGSKGTQVQSATYFPRNAAYLDTARMLVESGLALSLEETKLPSKGGGFFTPTTGMGQILFDRILKTGTYFASGVVSKQV